MSLGAVVVWGSFAIGALVVLAMLVFGIYLIIGCVRAVFSELPLVGAPDSDLDRDHDDALVYNDYLTACLCGAPRTDDHNKFHWRKHHGSTAEYWRDPPRPSDGLDKARW
jgi:hypothetical protein